VLFKYRGTVQIQRNSSTGSVLFNYRETVALISVLFKYRGTAALIVCYSNTEEQQYWLCVILIQRNSSTNKCVILIQKNIITDKCVILKQSNSSTNKCVVQIQRNSSTDSVLFEYRGTAVLVVCYSNTEEQQH